MPALMQMLGVAAVALIAVLAATVIRLVTANRRLARSVDSTRERFADYMDNGPFMAYMKDADGRYIYENRPLAEHIGRILPGTSTCLGRTDQDLFPPSLERNYVGNDRTVLQRGTALRFDETSVDADGTVRHWMSVKFPQRDERGRPCVAGISIDVTAARQARNDARLHEDRYALAIEAGRLGTLTLDLATQTLETSPLFATLHGRPETRTKLSLQESLADVHPEDRGPIVAAVEAALRDRAPSRITYRVVRADGGIGWIELMGQVYTDEAGRPAIVRGVAFDVTERQTAFEELSHRKAMLRTLIEVQEKERQTLCHELHDGMMQYAIGAKMLLEGVRDTADSAAFAERIDTVLDCLGRGIDEGRQVIRGVRSAVLDDLGLTAAIHDLADQVTPLGIVVETALDDGIDSLPPDLLTTVYRLVQESLTNVRKHAGASRVAIEVRRSLHEVRVRVSDDGKGFDVAAARTRGFGLVGMSERVRLAGGTCVIESRPGEGSSFSGWLPIPRTGDATASADGILAADAAAAAAAVREQERGVTARTGTGLEASRPAG
jgi:PAS domain S-box-containing protein